MPLARIAKYKRRWRLPASVAAGTGRCSHSLLGYRLPRLSPGTPEGLAYKTCVYRLPSTARVDYDTIVYRNGTRHRVAPCTHPTLAYPAMRPATGAASQASSSVSPPGTSQWEAQWKWQSPTWLTFLEERFSVPSNPSQSGALMYFFPAFETPTGNSILQPVLTWGNNGVVTNPNIWYITAWYGINGNYMPSGSIHVLGSAYTIDGSIVGRNCNGSGACQWTVAVSVVNGNQVTIPVTAGPFTWVFGGVMEVYEPIASCAELPPNGHEAFRNLSVTNHNGAMPSTTLFTSLFTDHCSAIVLNGVATGGDITWKS
jgi:hypothetical protein